MEQNRTPLDDRPRALTTRPAVRLLTAVAFLAVILDQLTKSWAVSALGDGSRWYLIPGLLWFRLIRNPGAAFSVGTGATWIFTMIGIVVIIAVLWLLRQVHDLRWGLALGLLLGGALGNLIDRLARSPGIARGHVVDFIEVPHYPVFNLADSCVVVAAVLIGLLGLRGIALDGSRGDG
jgi:signal peptidase II